MPTLRPLPNRTREHELVEESERKFADVLGPTLKFHQRAQIEYGIDGDIEHFDAEGNASGLQFFVQLKGTDEPDLRQGLATAIPLETANYYRQAPMPVLMVRYHAPTGALYARWFHQYDPYHGRGGLKTLTFRWQPGDIFGAGTPDRLTAEARAFYEVRKAAIRLPLSLYTLCSAELGFSEAELRIALRDLADERSDIFEVQNGCPPPGAVSIEARADAVVAHLGSVAGATLHLPDGAEGVELEATQVAVEALVLLALAFERVGQDALAARLAATYLPRSVMADDPEVAFAVSACMGRSHRIGEALALAEELDDPGDPDRAASGFVFGLAALMTADSLDVRDAHEYEAVLERRITRRRARHRAEAGVSAMNLAAYLRSRGRHEEAVGRYQEALELEPRYDGRAHFWSEFAGSLFLARHFEEAAAAYERAIDLGTDHSSAVALHADALLYAGHYREALTQLERYLSSDAAEEDDGEYRLKAFALTHLLERLGIEDQRRQTELVLEVGDGRDPADPDDWKQYSLAQLRLDALWGSAWLNLAINDREAGERENALCCEVLSTLLMPQDHEAWRNAIFAAFDAQEPAMAMDLLVVGQRTAGPPFTRYLGEQARKLPEPPRGAFLGAIDETLGTIARNPRPGVLLRLLSEDGVVEHSLEMPPSPMAEPTDSPSPPPVDPS